MPSGALTSCATGFASGGGTRQAETNKPSLQAEISLNADRLDHVGFALQFRAEQYLPAASGFPLSRRPRVST